MAGVSTLFLPVNSLPKTQAHDFIGGLEICRAMEKVVGPNKVDGSIRISGLWRLQVKDEKSRATLLMKGLPIRGINCTILSKNPYYIGDQESVKLIVGNLPFSISNDEIRKTLIGLGVQTASEIKWEHYREEKDLANPDKIQGLTSYKTGRRFIYIARPSFPIPQSIKVASNFTAFLYYRGQKEALEAAAAAEASAATRAKAYLDNNATVSNPGDIVVDDDPEVVEAEVNAETENILPAAAAAHADNNENNDSLNADLDRSVDSVNSQPMEHEDLTIRDGSSQAPLSSTPVSDVIVNDVLGAAGGGEGPDGEAGYMDGFDGVQNLSEITNPVSNIDPKKAEGLVQSLLRGFTWHGRSRSPKSKLSKTRRERSRSISQKRNHRGKPKSRDNTPDTPIVSVANLQTDLHHSSHTSISKSAEVLKEPPI